MAAAPPAGAPDNQSNTPTLHGTTSHVDPPGPTPPVDGQADEAITAPGVGSTRRLSIPSPKMLFADLFQSTKSPLSRLRLHPHPTPTPADYDPDLVSRDKAKQKEAIKRVLAEKVRDDWNFQWPPPAENETREVDLAVEGSNSEDDDASTYSTVSEDPTRFRPRVEWLSDMPEDEDEDDNTEPATPSAYRFDTPDAVGASVKAIALAKSAKRRRALRAEMEWNSGLACFSARRDAWTGARAARVRPKRTSTTASPTARHLSFWRHSTTTSASSPTESASMTAPLSPTVTRASGDTTAMSSSDAESKEARPKEDPSFYPVEMLVPVPQPLLPPATPMRTSITSAAYPTIYDKIVVQSATSSCPINLGDVTRACVAGWKRDGEWPPRPIEPPVVAVRKKKNGGLESKAHTGRRMSFGFLGRRQSVGGEASNLAESTSHAEKDDAAHASGKAFRKSIQRVLGIGHERAGGVNCTTHGDVAG
ncbi:hypothetical protein GGS23DRAFT_607689 [Durotheca rogersii]|uniref:uncharacterized protein n=1 Tax=Durotheca rogersii TaxID=419775 RepID=UPI00221FC10B|nr:uncharacterized protein GGS23DRAFT_607689 [Durotheca rogersii]KAI5858292.1 hypothetical protein GGS23DRAFT_607689 [Durotheca rogersii]